MTVESHAPEKSIQTNQKFMMTFLEEIGAIVIGRVVAFQQSKCELKTIQEPTFWGIGRVCVRLFNKWPQR